MPRAAVNSSPTCGFPDTAGLAVFFGAALDEITSVAAELAEVGPSPFEAVTTTRTVWSTSFALSVYVR